MGSADEKRTGGGGGGRGKKSGGGGGKSTGGGSNLSSAQQSQVDQILGKVRGQSPSEQTRQIDAATVSWNARLAQAEANIKRSGELIAKGDQYLRTTTKEKDRPFTTSVKTEREKIAKERENIQKIKDNLSVLEEVKRRLS